MLDNVGNILYSRAVHMTTWRIRAACWIPKAKNTYERTFGGQKFADDNEVMEAVQSWLKATPKSFFF